MSRLIVPAAITAEITRMIKRNVMAVIVAPLRSCH